VSVRPGAIVREAWASAVSQPVASVVTSLVVVAMILTVMLTTGRTVGAEQQVLGSIDEAGTRSIQVRAETGAGLTSDVLDRIRSVEGIEWAAAFSSAVDVTNTAIPDGSRVPVRLVYGSDFERLGIPATSPLSGESAYASRDALDQLGLPDGFGSITSVSGTSYAVVDAIPTPDFLAGFEPLVLVPQRNSIDGGAPISILVVIVDRPELVPAVSEAVLSVLAVDDPSKISVQTSEALAQLRAIVQSQLGTFSRGLVLLSLAVSGILVAVILFALVMMRRKDFGRRRALGASRALIVGLLLTQTVLLAVAGVVIGLIASFVALVLLGDPLPGSTFTLALAILAVTTAAVAALVPAFLASTREPIREIRVP